METLSEYPKIGFLPFIISLVAVWILHPQIIKVALLKEIVDTPNARKLQKEPVPILGGVAVFFGIFMSLMFSNIVIECSELFILLTAMLLMLYIGAIDDVLDISPQARLAAQIGAALVLVYLGNGYVVADLDGALRHRRAARVGGRAPLGLRHRGHHQRHQPRSTASTASRRASA